MAAASAVCSNATSANKQNIKGADFSAPFLFYAKAPPIFSGRGFGLPHDGGHSLNTAAVVAAVDFQPAFITADDIRGIHDWILLIGKRNTVQQQAGSMIAKL